MDLEDPNGHFIKPNYWPQQHMSKLFTLTDLLGTQ